MMKLIDDIAQPIYDLFVYDKAGTKPAWFPNGNSRKQDEAREYAKAALTVIFANLKKPSAEMIEVGGSRLYGDHVEFAEEVYHAMIDQWAREQGIK
jgi:hypothetical protein